MSLATSDLISHEYRRLQRQLHAEPRGYGGRGDKWMGTVVQLVAEHEATSVLDYGCGQGTLIGGIRKLQLPGVRLSEYDPAIPGKDRLPEFADLVVCTDVLEHIEPDRLMTVLAHLKMLARKVIFVVVSLKDSNKVLADGRNAHLIIRHAAWWKARFQEAGFTLRPAPTAVRSEPIKEWALILLP